MKYLLYTTIFFYLAVTTLYAQVPDGSFGTNGTSVLPPSSEYEEVNTALLQPDGKIVIGGYDYDETFYYPTISVWRVNANGSIDAGFGNGGRVRFSGAPPYGGSEYGGYLALQTDGKIVVLGSDFDRNGAKKQNIVLFRLQTNGTFDSSFGTNGKTFVNFGSFYCIAGALLVKPDGKILVTGTLEKNYSGSKRVELAQFLPNGAPDSSFGRNGTASSGRSYNQMGEALAALAGSKTLAGFEFSQDGAYQSGLVKYNSNGTVDTTFGTRGVVVNANSNSTNNIRMSLAIQSNGKIVEYATGTSNNVLYRYNANGGIDASFGTNGRVLVPQNSASLSVVIDANGHILINTPGFALLRYLPDGTLDTSFGINGKLTADFGASATYARSEQLLVQPDGKPVATGYVDFGKGVESFAVARFTSTAALQKSEPFVVAAKPETIVLYPNPVNSVLHIKGLVENQNYLLTITDAKGNVKLLKQVTGNGVLNWAIGELKNDLYYLTVTSNNSITTIRFIKQ